MPKAIKTQKIYQSIETIWRFMVGKTNSSKKLNHKKHLIAFLDEDIRLLDLMIDILDKNTDLEVILCYSKTNKLKSDIEEIAKLPFYKKVIKHSVIGSNLASLSNTLLNKLKIKLSDDTIILCSPYKKKRIDLLLTAHRKNNKPKFHYASFTADKFVDYLNDEQDSYTVSSLLLNEIKLLTKHQTKTEIMPINVTKAIKHLTEVHYPK